jgi:crossover junction endodeoxyribonuclease RusA
MTEIIKACTQLTLPWPPSFNGYWQPFAIVKLCQPCKACYFKGYTVTTTMALTKRSRMYRSEVHGAILEQLGLRKNRVAYEAPVRVDVELRAPDSRRRDIDNHMKGLFDALTHAGIWTDDHLVDEMTVRHGRNIRGGQAIVLITPLDAQPTETVSVSQSDPFDQEE